MNYLISRWSLLAALFLVFLTTLSAPRARAFGWPDSNDSMFPAAPAAKRFIDFDGRGFLIHGKRTFIVAGDMHYSRIPRAQWRTRLLRIQRAGYNTIQTYAFWNFHEPQEGKFNFSGDHDLDAYLKLIHSLGMYAIVRMGPYVNAEWDSGGLPVWLRFKPGLLPMTDNAPFWDAVNPYFDKLIPVLAANQITRGGPIIMVQLENENTSGGGTDLPNSYYTKYRDRVVRGGINVPYFFSGLNHNDDPAGADPFDTSQRTSPWYSTEFWTGWIFRYGPDAVKNRKLERATWKVIAYGGAGYTHYMLSGGSDFDTWNNNEQAASYDFGAPIGQAGDLRDDYYWVKRAALFATSFPAVLADSVAADGGGGLTATNGGVRLTNRTGKAGEIVFLDNNSDGPLQTQVRTADGTLCPHSGPLTLAPGEIMPVVLHASLLPGVSLGVSAARILGVATQGATTTLVIYGAPGEHAEMHFFVPASGAHLLQIPLRAGASLTQSPGRVRLTAVFPQEGPDVFTFRVGVHTIRVLAESSDLADRTWFVPVNGETQIVVGPPYVGEADVQGGRLVLDTEAPGLSGPASPGPALVFGPDGAQTLLPIVPAGVKPAPAAPPDLGPWSVDAATPEAQPGFDDSRWLKSDEPLQMGADGDNGAYAWYRATVNAPAAGNYALDISDAGDWLSCFVNGKHQDSTGVEARYQSPVPRRLNVTLNAGPNTLALLAAHYGRNKEFNYYLSLQTIDAKGISGTVLLSQQALQKQTVIAFRWVADDNGPNDAAALAATGLATGGPAWHDADTTTDVFHGRVGYAWFRATLPTVPGPHRRLVFSSIDDEGTVFLNGKQLADHVGVNMDYHVDLDPAWRDDGPNELAVLVHNTSGAGGLLGAVTLEGGVGGGTEIHGWRMRGGETPPAADAPDWRPLGAGVQPDGPAWYRTEFQATPPSAVGPHPILRVPFASLSRGFVYLNGHNLGRYPETSPIDGIYLQECWLNPGKNTLMIFDEDGHSPAPVKITVEEAASRRGVVLAARLPHPARTAER